MVRRERFVEKRCEGGGVGQVPEVGDDCCIELDERI
jgi:hypothetical protein